MFETIWACERVFLETLLNTILGAESADFEKPSAFIDDSTSGAKIYSIDQSGSHMTININGILTKDPLPWIYVFFGYSGTTYADIGMALEIAQSDDMIKSVTLNMDTPGGEVGGVDEVWQQINALAKTKKVTAESHGLVASAGYWIASAANKIVASAPTDTFGSIGVQITGYADTNPRRIVVTSSNAPNKNPDLATEKGVRLLQERANALERIFIDRVATGRGIDPTTVTEKFGQGDVMVASDPSSKKDALDVGMIDVISTTEPTETTGAELAAANANYPAIGIPKPKEVGMSILAKLMKENPDLAAEIKELETAAHDAGLTEGKAATQPVAPVVKPAPQADAKKPPNTKFMAEILASDAYPKSMKTMAVKVLSGEMTEEAFAGAMAAYEAVTEANKVGNAADNAPGATPPTPPTPPAEDGIINSPESLDQAVTDAKARRYGG